MKQRWQIGYWCGLSIIGLLACASHKKATHFERKQPPEQTAQRFIDEAEHELAALSIEANLANWSYETDITPEHESHNAAVSAKVGEATTRYAQAAARFNQEGLSPVLKRKLNKLRLSSTLAAPADANLNQELATLSTQLDGMYGSGKGDFHGQPLDLGALSNIVGDTQQTPADRFQAWKAWHAVGAGMKEKYTRLVVLANQGASELGFSDTGEMWRSKYDMPAEAFRAELERLWQQVRPLYEDLHCYVRGRLHAKYGEAVVSRKGPLPAHMMGNMWAQSWGNLYDEVSPPGDFPSAIDVTERLRARQFNEHKMVTTAERFYTSLGMRALPASFWTNSMFQKPAGKEAVCHASAWDIDNKNDVRIKMCIEITDEDFRTIHHELGHNYYQMAYQNQPFLFQDSANDGFHEAIGDTIALSVTPKYLYQIGVIDAVGPTGKENIPYLLQTALEKIAFLPFGLLVDQWRWKVFSGQVDSTHYNEAWWQLRKQIQGIDSVEERGPELFDAAAKYHVAGNVPYSRYFLAAILQFQFYRSLCEAGGHTGPLYQCSFFGSQIAGDKLMHMLEMGASKPWQEALVAMTGRAEMDATAIVEYFAPLQAFLKEQNRENNYICGW